MQNAGETYWAVSQAAGRGIDRASAADCIAQVQHTVALNDHVRVLEQVLCVD